VTPTLRSQVAIAKAALVPQVIGTCYNALKWTGMCTHVQSPHGYTACPLRNLQWCFTTPIMLLLAHVGTSQSQSYGDNGDEPEPTVPYRTPLIANWICIIMGLVADLTGGMYALVRDCSVILPYIIILL
jgi:bacteriorhodopsin